MLVAVALLNGVAVAPFLIAIMVIADDRHIMGDYANHTSGKLVGWATASIMTIAAVTVIVTMVLS
jgi:Mn2+/Fe2+ NRAMP family transporter